MKYRSINKVSPKEKWKIPHVQNKRENTNPHFKTKNSKQAHA